MFTIVATRTGDILFVTDNEDEANSEYYSLINEDGIPVHFT